MNPAEINTKSWHFQLVTYSFDKWGGKPPKDTCQYIKRMLEVFICMFIVAVAAGAFIGLPIYAAWDIFQIGFTKYYTSQVSTIWVGIGGAMVTLYLIGIILFSILMAGKLLIVNPFLWLLNKTSWSNWNGLVGVISASVNNICRPIQYFHWYNKDKTDKVQEEFLSPKTWLD